MNKILNSLWLAPTLTFLVLATGCQTIQSVFKPATAVVKIDFQGEPAEVPVTVGRFFPNEEAVAGVKMIQAGQLDEALRKFEAAVAAKPKDWEARIALAAVQEAQGKFPEAKQNYLQANLDKGGQADENAQAGIQRIDARLKSP